MSTGNFPLRLPNSVRKAAVAAAKKDGVSLNQFIATAVAEKTAVLNTVAYLSERGGRADRAAFDAVLARAGREPPRDGDEIEDKG